MGDRDKPRISDEEMRALAEAFKNGQAIVCYTRCWSCMAPEGCYEEPTPHTWMGKEDAEHAGLSWPLSAEEAAARPCACECAAARRKARE